jgi:hypothetical protein
MMLPQDCERVAAERARSQETEMEHRHLLSQIPRQPPRWRRWLGDGMVQIGTWLTSWGEWLAQRERRQAVPVDHYHSSYRSQPVR